MRLVTYLNFNGNCAEAMAFYAKVLNGQMGPIMRFSDVPPSAEMPPFPDNFKNHVMHTFVKFGTQELMGSDAMPETCGGKAYQAPGGITVAIQVDTVGEGQRIFSALSEGGTVKLPYAKTFWTEGFGMLTDRFGTPWMVNVYHEPV